MLRFKKKDPQKQEVMLSANYTIKKVDSKIIDLILQEKWGEIPHPTVMKPQDLALFREQLILGALEDYKGKYEKYIKVKKVHNLVPLVMRAAFASILVGDSVTPTFEAQYMALGDSNTAAANSDTILGNETLRGPFSDKFAIDNVAYMDKFFPSNEVGGNTYLEAGIFVDGSGSADTGYLLSRVLINETVGVNETLTFNCSFTIV